MEILSLLACFETLASATACRQLSVIAQAMFAQTGRITKLSLSRWTERGGSYRTINRFFATRLNWAQMLVKFFQTHLFDPESEYILAGDETVIGKSGRETFGIDRFFSGLRGQVIKGLSFFVFSLCNVQERKAYPLMVKQIVRSAAEKEAIKERKLASARKSQKKQSKPRGRPKGALNKNKKQLNLSPELLRISRLLSILLTLLRVFVSLRYLVLDGHFGHHQAVLMARENGLELISKLRCDAALFEQYEGESSGRGAKKKYGEKLRYQKLSPKYLKKSEFEGNLRTNYYQGIFLSKSFAAELNVVIVEKRDLKSRKCSHAIFFSSDLELSLEKMLEYYSLRFQIEFNFRDAKQHFGLEDFMTRTETGVETAANLSFLMVSLSAKLLAESNGKCGGILDLKSRFRGIKYAVETIKLVQPQAETILIEKVKETISRIGSIHQHNFCVSSP
jgi:putative transposase